MTIEAKVSPQDLAVSGPRSRPPEPARGTLAGGCPRPQRSVSATSLDAHRAGGDQHGDYGSMDSTFLSARNLSQLRDRARRPRC